MAYIKRAISGVLTRRVKTCKCTLVLGARQVGKSTLIKKEFPKYNRTNFDDKLTRLQAKEEPKLFLNNPCPLFIDEVLKEGSVLEEIKQILICRVNVLFDMLSHASTNKCPDSLRFFCKMQL